MNGLVDNEYYIPSASNHGLEVNPNYYDRKRNSRHRRRSSGYYHHRCRHCHRDLPHLGPFSKDVTVYTAATSSHPFLQLW